MKKFIVVIICLLLCAGVVGGAVAWYNKNNPNDKPVIDSPIETPNDNGGNTDNGENEQPSETPDVNQLTEPSNKSDIVDSRMKMKAGVELYFSDDGSNEPGIAFTCLLDKSLIEEVEADENKELVGLITSRATFDKVNTENKTYMDWISAFTPLGFTSSNLYKDLNYGVYDDNTYKLRLIVANITEANYTRELAAMVVVVDNSTETPTYKYAEMPNGETYRTYASSLISSAGESLNAYALGEAFYTTEQVAKMKGYINVVVDTLNGLEEPTDDNSMPAVTFEGDNSISLVKFTSYQIRYTLTPSDKKFVLSARYVSMNEDIAVVNSNGVVTGLSAGSTTVKVYIAGELYTINVNVSNNA